MERKVLMKANINLLRGYDNSNFKTRSLDKSSNDDNKAKVKIKSKKLSYFTKPDLYELPPVHSSKKR